MFDEELFYLDEFTPWTFIFMRFASLRLLMFGKNSAIFCFEEIPFHLGE